MTVSNPQKALTLIAAVALSLGLAQTASAGNLFKNQTEAYPQIQFSTKSADSSGQWRTLSNGCSYSRAQAPGYAPTWHLIVNPQRIGMPARPKNCKPMLGG